MPCGGALSLIVILLGIAIGGPAKKHGLSLVINPKEMFANVHHIYAGISKRVYAALFALGLVAANPAAFAQSLQWGINGHPFSQTGYFGVPLAEQVALVAETGAAWYRFDLSTQDFYASTERLDLLLALADKAGVRLLPVLICSSGARSGAGTPAQVRAAAFTFARAVVGRYKGRISHWELSNELDDYAILRRGDVTRGGKPWAWDPPDGIHADDFEETRYRRAEAEILGLGEGVAAADPGAVTIVDTAGWLHYGFIDKLVREDKVPFGILAWHWYSEMGDMTRVQGTLDLVSYLGHYGRPLWITEISRRNGSADGSDRELAAYMENDVAKLATNPGIGGLFIYELLDEPYFGPGNESSYGLVGLARAGDGTWRVSGRKPAFAALRSVVAASGSAAPRPH